MTSKFKIIEAPDGDLITEAHGKEYTIFVKVGNLKRGMPLFGRDWENHGQPCPAYVEMNEHGVVQAFRYPPGSERSGKSPEIYGRWTQQFRVSPWVKAIDLRLFLKSEEAMDLLQAIHDGHSIEADDYGRWVGHLDAEAEAAAAKFTELLRRYD